MSSFVAHMLVGASCFVLARPKTFRQAMPLVLIAGLLGLSPDIDYLLLWLIDWRPDPRITHSLVFVSILSLLAWAAVKMVSADKADFRLLLIFFAASISHLVLDALVGGTNNPIAWPFISEGFSSPVGVLPSAGKPNLFNLYFWRNLLIEIGIIVPVLAFGYSMVQTNRSAFFTCKVLTGLGVFLISLYGSLGLSR